MSNSNIIQQKKSVTITKASIVYFLAALFLCFEMALQISPAVMTPELKSSLNLTNFSLGVISGVYFISYTLMQIPSGMMYDRNNICKILTTAIFLCALGSISFSMAQGPYTAAISRLFMGIGSAFAFISVLTVSARYFPKKYFALLTGIAQLLAALGGVAGGLPIAWLIHAFGWRHVMLIFAGIGFILMLLVLWVFNDLPKINNKPNNKTTPKQNIFCSLLHIIKSRQHWYAFFYAFFNWAPVIAFASLWGVPFLKEAYHLSSEQAAGLCSLIWVGIGLTSPIIGGLSDYIKRRNILLGLTALIGCISVYFVIYQPHHSIFVLGVLLFLTGVGSAGQILSFAVVQDNTPNKRISTAIGINNMGVVASGIIFQPLIGKLMMVFNQHHNISNNISHHINQTLVFQKALIIVPASFLMCVLITVFLIKETRCEHQE